MTTSETRTRLGASGETELERARRALAALRPHPGAPLDSPAVNPRRFFALRVLCGDDDPWRRVGDPQAREQARLAAVAQALALPDSQRPNLLRALALLFWEWARAAAEPKRQPPGADAAWRLAHWLWRLLLPDADAWRRFAAEHDVADEHLDEARQRVVDEVLRTHLDQARRWLFAGDRGAAQFHLGCLANWREPAAPWLGLPPPRRSPESQALAEWIDSRAVELLNGWVSDVLARAKNQAESAAALENLPEGVSRDFAGALALLQPALEALPDNPRLLACAVEQWRVYAGELEAAGQADRAARVGALAARLALRLAAGHLTPGAGAHPDNQLVCAALRRAAYLTNASAQRLEWLEACVHWGGADEISPLELFAARARNLLDAKRFEEACDLLCGPRDAPAGAIGSELSGEALELRCHLLLRAGDAVLAARHVAGYGRFIAPLEEIERLDLGGAGLARRARDLRSLLRYSAGLAAFEAEDYLAAAREIQASLRIDPRGETARAQLAEVYRAWGVRTVLQAREALRARATTPAEFASAAERDRAALLAPLEAAFAQARQKFKLALGVAPVAGREALRSEQQAWPTVEQCYEETLVEAFETAQQANDHPTLARLARVAHRDGFVG